MKGKELVIEIPKFHVQMKKCDIKCEDTVYRFNNQIDDKLKFDGLKITLLTSTHKYITIENRLHTRYIGDIAFNFKKDNIPKTLSLPDYEYSNFLKCTIEDKGMGSKQVISEKVATFFKGCFMKVSADLEILPIILTDDKGKSTKTAIGELFVVVPRMASEWHILSIINRNVDDEMFRLKPKCKVTWVPAFGTRLWSVLNKAAYPDHSQIVEYIKPKHVSLEYRFIGDYLTWSILKLQQEGYVKVLGYSTPIEQYSRPHKIKRREINDENKPLVEQIHGVWIKLTDKGKAFHKKNTDKQFRMINCLSGDPRCDDIEEVKKI